MSTRDEVLDRVRRFILVEFPLARSQTIRDGDSLLDGGVIDSMGAVEVVTFIETEFRITVSDEEMVSDNFESISSLADFVHERITADGAAESLP